MVTLPYSPYPKNTVTGWFVRFTWFRSSARSCSSLLGLWSFGHGVGSSLSAFARSAQAWHWVLVAVFVRGWQGMTCWNLDRVLSVGTLQPVPDPEADLAFPLRPAWTKEGRTRRIAGLRGQFKREKFRKPHEQCREMKGDAKRYLAAAQNSGAKIHYRFGNIKYLQIIRLGGQSFWALYEMMNLRRGFRQFSIFKILGGIPYDFSWFLQPPKICTSLSLNHDNC